MEMSDKQIMSRPPAEQVFLEAEKRKRYEPPEIGITLYDLQLNPVKKWDIPAERIRVKNCNLYILSGQQSKLFRGQKRIKAKVDGKLNLEKTLIKYDKDGKYLWHYTNKHNMHHDFQVLDEDRILLIEHYNLPLEFKKLIRDGMRKKEDILTDSFFIINEKGEELWRWNIFDRFNVNTCGKKSCATDFSNVRHRQANQDWTHVNTITLIPENKYYPKDKRFKPGNIMFIVRNWSGAYIIDYPSGNIVWESYGDFLEGGFDSPHDIQMIPEGYPGAGNMLVLDNGAGRGFSRVVEFNPAINDLVWKYEAGKDFFTPTRGAVQRLKDGRTLISEDARGRFFIVNSKGEIELERKDKDSGHMLSMRAKMLNFGGCL